ncbi:MAG: hypothetical protein J7K98_00385, partial [Candidatus Aenigmarchaeota archaeon]|nr:hypothetical protein [Candidatus Aenigmarchaeota archaeon]
IYTEIQQLFNDPVKYVQTHPLTAMIIGGTAGVLLYLGFRGTKEERYVEPLYGEEIPLVNHSTDEPLRGVRWKYKRKLIRPGGTLIVKKPGPLARLLGKREEYEWKD